MADIADVEVALREAVQAARSGIGGTYPVYRGWPAPATLDASLATGKPVVTVYSRAGFSRTTTRFPNEEVELARTTPTLTASMAGNVVTFGGAGGPAQLAGVQVGTTAYSVRAAGMPASVAAALAAIVPGATASGAVLTVPGLVSARTGADGGTLRPTRQMQQGFSVIVWSPDPAQRDAISSAIDAALSDISFLSLADGSHGHLTYSGTTVTDKAENAGLYRRDINLLVEYSTTIAAVRSPVLFEGQALRPGVTVAPAVPATPAAPETPAQVAVVATIRVGALSP